ncbi:MAG: extracellular solute-binding protein [Candidatus Brachytrichaceae bacterium NZ_4S206]|jgi:multiple sugar transport system substrate-binding protein
MYSKFRACLGILAAALLLAACAAPSPAVQAPPPPTSAPAEAPQAAQPAAAGKFRIWKQFADGDDLLMELMAPWAKENNVEIELTSGIDDMAKYIAAITGGDPPDLIILSGPDDIGTWAREGLVVELDDVIKTQGINLDEIFPGPLSTCRYFGKLYCLPWGTDVYALFWNKDLFKEAGLDPERPPETLEELALFAEKLTKYDADGNLTQIGFLPNFSWSHIDTYALAFGAAPFSEDGTKVTINSPEFIQAMEWQRQFYTKVGFDKIDKFTQGFGEYSSPQAGFNAGKVAMMIEGEWQPKFIREAGVTNLNYGIAAPPHPANHPERAGTVSVGGTVMAIATGVKNPELSAKALAFLQSPGPLADFMVFNNNLPTTKSAAQDPRFRQDEKFAIFMDLLAGPNAKSFTRTPINSEVFAAISEAEEMSFRDPNFDLKAFLDAKAAELQPLLDKANSR